MTSTPHDRVVSRRTALAGAGLLGLTFAMCGSIVSAQDASPEATPSPMDGYPMIGSWQWTNYPGAAWEDQSLAIFTGSGRYVEINDSFFAIGVWRPTGERTAEVVMNPGQPNFLGDVFEPQYVIAEDCLMAREPRLLRIMIEIDETGNRMTGTGTFEEPDSNGDIIQTDTYEGVGDRMTVAWDLAATPTS